jgi:hypothetical protein
MRFNPYDVVTRICLAHLATVRNISVRCELPALQLLARGVAVVATIDHASDRDRALAASVKRVPIAANLGPLAYGHEADVRSSRTAANWHLHRLSAVREAA